VIALDTSATSSFLTPACDNPRLRAKAAADIPNASQIAHTQPDAGRALKWASFKGLAAHPFAGASYHGIGIS